MLSDFTRVKMMTIRALAGLLLAGLVTSANAAALQIALTFDDLPAHGPLAHGETRLGVASALIKAIKENGLPPVYGFVNAEGVEKTPAELRVLKDWLAAGQKLGNHTWSHPDLNVVSAKAFNNDIARDEPLLRRLAGKTDWRWFRYPFLDQGNTRAKRLAVRKFLAQHAYKVAWVTMDFADYLWNDTYGRCAALKDEAAILELERNYLDAAAQYITYWRTLSAALYGRDIPYVALLHFGAFDARMLDRLIELYRSRGFSFVTLEQAQRDPVYQPYLDPAKPSAFDSLEMAMEQRGLELPKVTDFETLLNGMCHKRVVASRNTP